MDSVPLDNPLVCGENGCIHEACFDGDLEDAYERLCDIKSCGIDINAMVCSEFDHTLLELAIFERFEGDELDQIAVPLVRWLLQAGVDPDRPTLNGNHIAFDAAYCVKPDILKMLEEHTSLEFVDLTDRFGDTLLHKSSSPATTKWLLYNIGLKRRIHHKNTAGKTALDLAHEDEYDSIDVLRQAMSSS